MASFWKKVGSMFAKIGLYAAKGAVWASDHPAVISQVVGIAAQAGVPASALAKVNQGVAISNVVVADVAAVVAAVKTPPVQ